MFDKERIARNFSRAADTYDRYADIQRAVANDLLTLCPATAANIIEIGCGTGLFTEMLRQRYARAALIALDIADGMTAVARRRLAGREVTVVTVDAEDYEFTDVFDLVAANAAVHWLADLHRFIRTCARALGPGSQLVFSSFGPATYAELHAVIADVVPGQPALSAARFPDEDELHRILKRFFAEVTIQPRTYRRTYPALLPLLRAIKHTGTRGAGLGDGVALGKDQLRRLEAAYRERYGDIVATYQVYLCRGAAVYR